MDVAAFANRVTMAQLNSLDHSHRLYPFSIGLPCNCPWIYYDHDLYLGARDYVCLNSHTGE